MQNELRQWMDRYCVDKQAREQLIEILNVVPNSPPSAFSKISEDAVKQRRQLKSAREGGVLWRNNVGACIDERGSLIRYGLANVSKKMNSRFKSSDLIGITPVIITPAHVGQMLGVFTAEECKHGGWEWQGTEREVAQLRYINLVKSMGGYAEFTRI